MPSGCGFHVAKHSRKPIIECKFETLYLGCMLDAAGNNGSEVSRKLGSANAGLHNLTRTGKHSAVSSERHSKCMGHALWDRFCHTLFG